MAQEIKIASGGRNTSSSTKNAMRDLQRERERKIQNEYQQEANDTVQSALNQIGKGEYFGGRDGISAYVAREDGEYYTYLQVKGEANQRFDYGDDRIEDAVWEAAGRLDYRRRR